VTDSPDNVVPFQAPPAPANRDPVPVLDRNKYAPVIDLTSRRSYACIHTQGREVDEQARKIICTGCKAELDPYKCLQDIALDWENRNLIWKQLCDDIARAKTSLESLKREEANARARIRRLRDQEAER
jgi:hypothetical protein